MALFSTLHAVALIEKAKFRALNTQPKVSVFAKQKFSKTSQFWTLRNEPEKHAKTRKYIKILPAGKYFAGKILRAPKADFLIFKDQS